MSPAAVREAALRHQSHAELHYAQTITLGARLIKAAVRLFAIRPELDPEGGGSIYVQRGEIDVRKTSLPVCPARGTLVTIDGVEFTIVSNGGQLQDNIAWCLQIMRLPPRV